ncbi:MAG: hypothetical protein QOG54_113 [Actinomycetota bacterium]|jgi:hypothetical protein|nr:hypothetical protein [Actinomycetota bacterium]
MPKTATKPDRFKEAHDRLVTAVESITSGDDWERMLKVASKFHKYSFNNQLLIFLQHPVLEGMYVYESDNRPDDPVVMSPGKS